MTDDDSSRAGGGRDVLERIGWLVLVVGVPSAALAFAVAPAATSSAARQDWPPFVLVTGLLLLGTVAAADGLFDAAGAGIAALAGGGLSLVLAAAGLVAVVTAVLNLDTAVAFLTPVLVLAARRHGTPEAPLLYLAVFMANGASLLLPGSNLTNLIVLGRSPTSGGSFAAHMLPAWIAAVVAVTVVVAVHFRRSLSAGTGAERRPVEVRFGAGAAGVVVAVAAMLALPVGAGAVVVLVTGCLAATWSATRRRISRARLRRSVNLPVLLGLFGLAVALGALARNWLGPSTLMAHVSSWQAAMVGAGTSVLVNNLPAASLLSARPVPDPYALLIGLNLGPNLAVTGALSAALWLQVATPLGARPSVTFFSRLGVVVTVVSMAAALGALALLG